MMDVCTYSRRLHNVQERIFSGAIRATYSTEGNLKNIILSCMFVCYIFIAAIVKHVFISPFLKHNYCTTCTTYVYCIIFTTYIYYTIRRKYTTCAVQQHVFYHNSYYAIIAVFVRKHLLHHSNNISLFTSLVDKKTLAPTDNTTYNSAVNNDWKGPVCQSVLKTLQNNGHLAA